MKVEDTHGNRVSSYMKRSHGIAPKHLLANVQKLGEIITGETNPIYDKTGRHFRSTNFSVYDRISIIISNIQYHTTIHKMKQADHWRVLNEKVCTTTSRIIIKFAIVKGGTCYVKFRIPLVALMFEKKSINISVDFCSLLEHNYATTTTYHVLYESLKRHRW